MGNSAKANRFNVSRLVYALITKDDDTGVNNGPIRKLGEPMQVQLTPSYATGTLYGGGVKTEDISKMTGIALKLDVNKIAIEDRAIIGGHTYENGVLIEKAGDQAPNIAVGYEVEETENHKELVWLLKGKAKPIANTQQQSTDNITFSTDSLEIGFVPRTYDKEIKVFGDTANPDFTSEDAAVFLDSVPGSTLVTDNETETDPDPESGPNPGEGENP